MLCSAAPLLRRGRSHAELHLKREKRELHCAGANRAEPPRFASARKSRWGLAEFGARRFAKRTLRHIRHYRFSPMMLAAAITLPHFLVSSEMSLPKSAG